MRNIFGDQGNMERNFWEQGNSVKVNFGEHLNLFLRNKGTTVNFPREQGNLHPPSPREALIVSLALAAFGLSSAIFLSALITGIIVLSIKGSQSK